MVKIRGNLYYSTETCRVCGLKLPGMPFCRLTGTCARCAISILSRDKCEICPSRDECEQAVRGLDFISRFEQSAIALVPDLASLLIEYVSSLLRELNTSSPDAKAELFVKVFLSVTSTLTLSNSVPLWVQAVFKPETIRAVSKTPLDVILLPGDVERALEDYGRALRTDPEFVKNLFRFLLAHYVLRYREKSFLEYLRETFSDSVVEALRRG